MLRRDLRLFPSLEGALALLHLALLPLLPFVAGALGADPFGAFGHIAIHPLLPGHIFAGLFFSKCGVLTFFFCCVFRVDSVLCGLRRMRGRGVRHLGSLTLLLNSA